MDKKKRSTMLKWIVMVEVALILMIVNVLLVIYMDKVCNVGAQSTKMGIYRISPEEQQVKETSLAAAAK